MSRWRETWGLGAGADDLDAAADPASEATVRHRSTRGGGLLLAGQGIKLLLSIGSLMVLARLLGPRPYGLLAMVEIVSAAVLQVGGFGFQHAVVQQPTLEAPALRRVFRVNLGLCAVLWAVVAASGPLLAWFFNEPVLVLLAGVVGLGPLANNAATVHMALLRRRMRFGLLGVIEVGAVMIGAAAGIAAALAGWGVWALAVQQVGILMPQAAVIAAAARWWPAGPVAARDDAGYRRMIQYGKGQTTSKVVKVVSENLDKLVIGRLAGAAALGLYANAWRWAWMPQKQLVRPLTTVALAGASRVRSEASQYRRYLEHAILAASAATLPLLGYLVVAAKPVVAVIFGDQWLDAAPLLALLSLAVALTLPVQLSKVVLHAEGRVREVVHLSVASAVTQIVAIGLGAMWGAVGIAAGVAAARGLVLLPQTGYALRGSSMGWPRFMASLTRPAVAATTAAVTVAGVRYGLGAMANPLAAVAVTGGVFALAYALVGLALPGGWRDAVRLRDAAWSVFRREPTVAGE